MSAFLYFPLNQPIHSATCELLCCFHFLLSSHPVQKSGPMLWFNENIQQLVQRGGDNSGRPRTFVSFFPISGVVGGGFLCVVVVVLLD